MFGGNFDNLLSILLFKYFSVQPRIKVELHKNVLENVQPTVLSSHQFFESKAIFKMVFQTCNLVFSTFCDPRGFKQKVFTLWLFAIFGDWVQLFYMLSGHLQQKKKLQTSAKSRKHPSGSGAQIDKYAQIHPSVQTPKLMLCCTLSAVQCTQIN